MKGPFIEHTIFGNQFMNSLSYQTLLVLRVRLYLFIFLEVGICSYFLCLFDGGGVRDKYRAVVFNFPEHILWNACLNRFWAPPWVSGRNWVECSQLMVIVMRSPSLRIISIEKSGLSF